MALDRDDRLFLDGRGIASAEALKSELEALVQRRADLGVVLNADSGARHGRVVQVLDILRGSGAKKIYVGTVQK